MKILLDENVMPKAKEILVSMKHEAELSIDVVGAGASDEEVFKHACENRYALITHNGKDFIVFIPPVCINNCHFGFIWLKCEVTNRNCDTIFAKIGKFLTERKSITDQYFSVKFNRSTSEVNIDLRYPKQNNIIYGFK